jgi:hypothetical protein
VSNPAPAVGGASRNGRARKSDQPKRYDSEQLQRPRRRPQQRDDGNIFAAVLSLMAELSVDSLQIVFATIEERCR